MQWAFIDYENTGSLEAIDVEKYERIFVFLGPKNKKLKLGQIASGSFCKLELMSLNTVGPNNLDFHLAFHIGRFHEIADSNVEFHIITNDSGFNGLVCHLKQLGRKCKKVLTKQKKEKSSQAPPLSECSKLVVNRLAPMDGRKRPRKKAKLLNWIRSQCGQVLNGADPEPIYKELQNAKIVRESGSNITYSIKS